MGHEDWQCRILHTKLAFPDATCAMLSSLHSFRTDAAGNNWLASNRNGANIPCVLLGSRSCCHREKETVHMTDFYVNSPQPELHTWIDPAFDCSDTLSTCGGRWPNTAIKKYIEHKNQLQYTTVHFEWINTYTSMEHIINGTQIFKIKSWVLKTVSVTAYHCI